MQELYGALQATEKFDKDEKELIWGKLGKYQ
jgi:hypothetical protein